MNFIITLIVLIISWRIGAKLGASLFGGLLVFAFIIFLCLTPFIFPGHHVQTEGYVLNDKQCGAIILGVLVTICGIFFLIRTQ